MLKCPSALFFGILMFIPFYNVDLITVIGGKLDLPQISNPTDQDITKYHNLYMEHLNTVYNKHKKSYGGSEELVMY